MHLLGEASASTSGSGTEIPREVNDEGPNFDAGIEDYDLFDIDAIEYPEAEHSDESEDFFLLYYGDFMNRLCHDKFIPHSTVQDISEEFLNNSKKSQEICERKLRDELRDVENLSSTEADKIVSNVVKDDFFIKAQEQLNTQYKRTKFVQERMQYVAPVEILLNKSEVEQGLKKDVIHYVPLDVALKNLLEDKSLVKLLNNEKKRQSKDANVITDILDGSLVKTTPFFQENEDALSLIFYSDGVELKNPLGAARGTYKVTQVFYTLANIPKAQRSQVDRLHLCMIYKEKLTKKYSFNVIYKALIEDLKKLENGLKIDSPEPRVVKAGLLLHSADNLEAHILGGFSASFSSKSICRFCHIQHNQLEDNIHDYCGDDAHERWTVSEYDNCAGRLEQENAPDVDVMEGIDGVDEDEDDVSSDSEDEDDDHDSDNENDETPGDHNRWGLKHNCHLNTLKSFHCTSGFPPHARSSRGSCSRRFAQCY